jgi:type VI secretion system protein ImpK
MMSNNDDDPFFGSGDSDRTILRPTPGGRRGPAAPTPAPPPQQLPMGQPQQPAYGQPVQPQMPGGLPDLSGGVNPLSAAATTLLALIAQLRDSASHPDPQALFQHVSQEIQQFEANARNRGEPPDVILGARYVLCTAVDETVLNTPWGSQSVWATQTLLGTFHNETWGGEKFFQLLDRLLQEPAKNLHLLELMYLCLTLGFEGKFRVQERGRAMLESIMDNLYQAIRMHRGDFERGLSPRWRGVEDKRTPLAKYVPLWVVAAVSAGLLMVVFWGFLMALNSASNPALAEIASLGRNVPPLVRDRVYQAPVRQEAGLSDYLQNEINAGLVDVRDIQQGEVVIIGGDGLFASGSSEVRSDSVPVLLAIADALSKVQGRVMITGHTDSVPIRSLRYPSNWHLSEARANAVQQILTTRVAPDRLSSEGLADTRPVAPNDSAANRAQNRRVEIMLLTAGRL